MEVLLINREKGSHETTVVLEIKNFMSLDEKVLIEVKVPFEKDLKWGFKVEPMNRGRGRRNYAMLYLTNPKDKRNHVHARLRTVLVDREGNDVSGEQWFGYCDDFSTRRPGEGWGVRLVERKDVRTVLVEGSLMVKCVVSVAEEFLCSVKNLPSSGSGIQVDCTIGNFVNCRDLISEAIVTPFDDQVRWRVLIFPRGASKKDEGHVSMYLCRANDENNEKVLSYFSILDKNGKVAFARKFDDWIDFAPLCDGQGIGWFQFLSRDKLKKLLVNGNLHLRVLIRHKSVDEQKLNADKNVKLSVKLPFLQKSFWSGIAERLVKKIS